VTYYGRVGNRLEAGLRLRFRGPNESIRDFDAIIDTGYTGMIILPFRLAEVLGLVGGMGGQATLADGSSRRFDTFSAEVEWGGTWKDVIVSAIGDEVLVGMRFLSGLELRIEVVPGGIVEIAELKVD
jgi:clan AA aspartic protease